MCKWTKPKQDMYINYLLEVVPAPCKNIDTPILGIHTIPSLQGVMSPLLVGGTSLQGAVYPQNRCPAMANLWPVHAWPTGTKIQICVVLLMATFLFHPAINRCCNIMKTGCNEWKLEFSNTHSSCVIPQLRLRCGHFFGHRGNSAMSKYH